MARRVTGLTSTICFATLALCLWYFLFYTRSPSSPSRHERLLRTYSSPPAPIQPDSSDYEPVPVTVRAAQEDSKRVQRNRLLRDELDESIARGDRGRYEAPIGAVAVRSGKEKVQQEIKLAREGKGVSKAVGKQRGSDEGWSKRFKPKQQSGNVVDPVIKVDTLRTMITLSGILAHPLVARILSRDYTLSAERLSQPPTKSTPPPKIGEGDQQVVHHVNLTLCALVSEENRFLPEWLLYHRWLGVERFALYDHVGAAGIAEVDEVAQSIEARGKGALGSTAEEVKQVSVRAGSQSSGLDDDGKICVDRLQGMEEWIDQNIVQLHYFDHGKQSFAYHEEMIQHCSRTYSLSTKWMSSLDVDEFLVVASDNLYDIESPALVPSKGDGTASLWQFPLHDLLGRNQASCIPLPTLEYRNIGIRELEGGASGVIETHTMRNVIHPENVRPKPDYGASSVDFAGVHSCRAGEDVGKNEIRDAQNNPLQAGGTYENVDTLPIEPLVVAHYKQRDLHDCREKLSHLDDPNSIHAFSTRGADWCEEYYVPTLQELTDRKLGRDPLNQILMRPPTQGIVQDRRASESWSGKATKAILAEWAKKGGAKSKLSAAKRKRLRDRVVKIGPIR